MYDPCSVCTRRWSVAVGVIMFSMPLPQTAVPNNHMGHGAQNVSEVAVGEEAGAVWRRPERGGQGVYRGGGALDKLRVHTMHMLTFHT